MKEDEAKTKWCPMVRHEGDDHGSFNRGGVSDPINAFGIAKGYGCGCIASACMMWRWVDAGKEYVFQDPNEDGWEFDPYHSEYQFAQHLRWSRIKQGREGCCGLAGVPI